MHPFSFLPGGILPPSAHPGDAPETETVMRHLLLVFAVLFATPLSAAEPPVTAICFAPDGKSLVAASQAGLSIRNWPELNVAAKPGSFETGLANIRDLAFSPNGKHLAVAGGTPAEAGVVEVFSWPDGKRLSELQGHSDSVSGVAWIDDGSLAAASLDHEVSVWDLGEADLRRKLKGHSRGVTTIAVVRQQDKVTLVTAGLDQNLRVWELATGRQIRSLKNHTREVHQLAVRPATEGLPMVASISRDHTVRLWQPTIGRMVRFARLESPPLAVAWLPDGSLVAVTSTDGAVRLVDPDTAKVVRKMPALHGWAYSLAAHPEDGSLAVGGRNGALMRVFASDQ